MGVEELPTFSLKQYFYTLNSTLITLQLSDVFQNKSANENSVFKNLFNRQKATIPQWKLVIFSEKVNPKQKKPPQNKRTLNGYQ